LSLHERETSVSSCSGRASPERPRDPDGFYASIERPDGEEISTRERTTNGPPSSAAFSRRPSGNGSRNTYSSTKEPPARAVRNRLSSICRRWPTYRHFPQDQYIVDNRRGTRTVIYQTLGGCQPPLGTIDRPLLRSNEFATINRRLRDRMLRNRFGRYHQPSTWAHGRSGPGKSQGFATHRPGGSRENIIARPTPTRSLPGRGPHRMRG